MRSLATTHMRRARERPLGVALSVLAVAVLTALGAGSAPAAGPPDGKGGGHVPGAYDAPTAIHSMQIGGEPVLLTQGPGFNVHRDAAPHARGGRVVFASDSPSPTDGSTDAELYVRESDGRIWQLTDTPAAEANPELSPNGQWVAYDDGGSGHKKGGCSSGGHEEEDEDEGCSGHETETGDVEALAETPAAVPGIWVVNLDSLAATKLALTTSPATAGAAVDPTWSPDGTKIAYAVGSSREAHIEEVGVTLAGTPAVAGPSIDVTTPGYHHSQPAWSPVPGTDVIAYTRSTGTRADLWTIDRGTTPPTYRLLTPTVAVGELRAAWSPDGTKIAYQRADGVAGESIWMMNADGSGGEPVTEPDGWSDRTPSFSAPDALVFASTQNARPAADLSVVAGGDPATTTVGGTVTIRASVVSFARVTVSGVTVTLALGDGLWFVSGTASVGTETLPLGAVDGVVTLELAELEPTPAGEDGPTIEVVATAGVAGTWTSTATVSLAEAPNLFDPAAENDTATVTTVVGIPATPPAPAPAPAPPAAGPSPAAPGPFLPPSGGPKCTITGTAGDDVLVGTTGADVICGLGGDDTISGLGGNDLLIGGPGEDALNGGPGNDVLNGGDGDDVVNGLSGNDVLYGGAGDDVLTHRSGRDRLFAGAGNDRLFARDGGYDWVNGGLGVDTARIDRRIDRTYGVERLG